MLGGVVEMNY